MREIVAHQVTASDRKIHIGVLDAPGPGGACHAYEVEIKGGGFDAPLVVRVPFQKGPIKKVGLNGITMESLLAIIGDRLQGFQSGEHKCALNAEALLHVNMAMTALQTRTRMRTKARVEGTEAQGPEQDYSRPVARPGTEEDDITAREQVALLEKELEAMAEKLVTAEEIAGKALEAAAEAGAEVARVANDNGEIVAVDVDGQRFVLPDVTEATQPVVESEGKTAVLEPKADPDPDPVDENPDGAADQPSEEADAKPEKPDPFAPRTSSKAKGKK